MTYELSTSENYGGLFLENKQELARVIFGIFRGENLDEKQSEQLDQLKQKKERILKDGHVEVSKIMERILATDDGDYSDYLFAEMSCANPYLFVRSSGDGYVLDLNYVNDSVSDIFGKTRMLRHADAIINFDLKGGQEIDFDQLLSGVNVKTSALSSYEPNINGVNFFDYSVGELGLGLLIRLNCGGHDESTCELSQKRDDSLLGTVRANVDTNLDFLLDVSLPFYLHNNQGFIRSPLTYKQEDIELLMDARDVLVDKIISNLY